MSNTLSGPPAAATLKPWRSRGWVLCGAVSIAFAAGFLVSAQVTRAAQKSVRDSRLFELNIYHTVPGKVPALVARFSEGWKLQAKHGLNVLGYWVPSGDPAWDNTFVYLVAHASREEARRNWQAFHADPEFQKHLKSEQAEPLIERVDTAYMYATDFSRLK